MLTPQIEVKKFDTKMKARGVGEKSGARIKDLEYFFSTFISAESYENPYYI